MASQRDVALVRKAQRMLAAWVSESMLRTPNAPQILAVILSTGKKLLQPFAPANSNLTQTRPARTFQHKTPVSVLEQRSLNVKQIYLRKEEKKLSAGG